MATRSLQEMKESEANFVMNSDVQSSNKVRIFIQTPKTSNIGFWNNLFQMRQYS